MTANADTLVGLLIIGGGAIWLLTDRIVAVLAWIDRRNWESQIDQAIRLTEEDEAADEAWSALPIYSATVAHVAKYAAQDIAREWAEMNGDVS